MKNYQRELNQLSGFLNGKMQDVLHAETPSEFFKACEGALEKLEDLKEELRMAMQMVIDRGASNHEIAAKIEATAKNWEDSHIRRWGSDSKEPDPTMVRAGRQDASDMRQVALLVRLADLAAASKLAWSLDTIVREELPGEFYTLLKYRS